MSRSDQRRRSSRLALGVSLLALAAYLVTANGHLQGPDQEYYYRMARSLALEHTFAVEPQPDVAGGQRGLDGRFYAQYAPGLPVLLAPLVLAGQAFAEPLGQFASASDSEANRDSAAVAMRFLMSYVNAPITAAIAGALALLVVRLGYSFGTAVFASLTFALATFAWGQARSVFPEPLQTLLLLLSVVLLLRASAQRAALGGTALGLAILVKLTSVLYAPALLLLPDASGRPLWRRSRLALAVIVPAAAAIAIHGLYNLLRFGDPLTTAYYSGDGVGGVDFNGDLWVGLYGLLLSTGRGVVWYAPPVAVAAFGLVAFYRHHPQLTRALIVVAVVWTVVHARWADWHAGWGWGPRYMLPVLPILLLPLSECWNVPRLRRIAVAVAGPGVLVQIPGSSIDFMEWGQTLLNHCSVAQCWHTQTERFLDPGWSDLAGHTQLLLAGHLDLAWLTFGRTWLGPLTICLALALAYAGCWLLEPLTREMASRPSHRDYVPVGIHS